ncbi:hypothetical protein CCACVL1_15360 [Corchorus capsularis]|uniref:Uncharacterized protein n=1 Tax=Corchorus capsularis TaxID=210143 RepID=A0A1R3I321_COCAP|nr:hypothetical protein CCACVL1_15360 [Corchorus capsularis]
MDASNTVKSSSKTLIDGFKDWIQSEI